jgi:hypothetical protein
VGFLSTQKSHIGLQYVPQRFWPQRFWSQIGLFTNPCFFGSNKPIFGNNKPFLASAPSKHHRVQVPSTFESPQFFGFSLFSNTKPYQKPFVASFRPFIRDKKTSPLQASVTILLSRPYKRRSHCCRLQAPVTLHRRAPLSRSIVAIDTVVQAAEQALSRYPCRAVQVKSYKPFTVAASFRRAPSSRPLKDKLNHGG